MRTITLGLLGSGTVGSGVIKLLQTHQDKIEQTSHVHFSLKRVVVHHLEKHINDSLPAGTILSDNINDIIDDPDIQVVIETMGTINLARRVIEQAIYHGKSVITANKDLLATDGPRLAKLAHHFHVDFLYEASVAGGIPILRVLSNSLVTDQINQITGIINGTANYILTAMDRDGLSYQEALTDAQTKGYAESDPTNDVEGIDAANKLSILSQFAFGRAIDPQKLAPFGIDTVTRTQLSLAKQFGYVVKLLAIAKRVNNQIMTFVGPAIIPADSQLGQVDGVQNAIAINSSALGTTIYTGPGAGAEPTANSILSDLVAVADHIRHFDCGKEFNTYHNHLKVKNLTSISQSYLVTVPQNNINVRPNELLNWQKESFFNSGWAGITPVINNDQLQAVKKEISKDNPGVQFLPIVNSWSFKPVLITV